MYATDADAPCGDSRIVKRTRVQTAVEGLRDRTGKAVLLSNPTLPHAEFLASDGSVRARGVDGSSFEAPLVALQPNLPHAPGILSALWSTRPERALPDCTRETRLLGNIETTTAKLSTVGVACQPARPPARPMRSRP